MARKGTVAKAKRKPSPKAKKKKKPESQKAQSERFIETARKLGVDETGEAFERALEKIAPPKR